MTSFFDVNLEQITQVVQRRTGLTQAPLLLDRSRLGVALRHDQSAQCTAIFAWNFLPRRFALMIAKRDFSIALRLGEKYPPAIIGHLHVAETRPSLRIDRSCGA